MLCLLVPLCTRTVYSLEKRGLLGSTLRWTRPDSLSDLPMLSAMSLMTGDAAAADAIAIAANAAASRHNVLKVVDFIRVHLHVHVHVQLQVAGRVLRVGALSVGNK